VHTKYKLFEDIKERSDFLVKQLCEGVYTSQDVYSNNLLHLIHIYCELNPFIKDPDFIEWVRNKEPVALLEIAETGRIIMALQNFSQVFKKDII